MKTYKPLPYKGQYFLVRMPVVEKPEEEQYYGRPYSTATDSVDWDSYNEHKKKYESQFQSAILVPPEHVEYFEKMGEVPESAFEVIVGTPNHSPEICGCEHDSNYCPFNPHALNVPYNEKYKVAIPIAKDQESQDELWREFREMFFDYYADYSISKSFDKLTEKFTIQKRIK